MSAEDRTSKPSDAASTAPHQATGEPYNANGESGPVDRHTGPAGQPDLSATGEVRTSGKAIAAFVLSIAGLIALPLVCSTLAVILAAVGRKEIDVDPQLKGRGLATAGLVIGIVGLVLAVIALVIILAAR